MRIQTIDTVQHLSFYVENHLQTLLQSKDGRLHLGVSGGRSASYLIEGLLRLSNEQLRNIDLYLVDERLEGERNLDSLLAYGLENAIKTRTLKEKQIHIPKVGEVLSQDQFDAVYLSSGEDGHFASLFPFSYHVRTKDQTVLVENSPKAPKRRVSLSYEGFLELASSAQIRLLIFGEDKREAFIRLLSQTENPETLPISFLCKEPFHTTVITDLEVEL
jgi:6-phosphogluconolactonase/glucosamine-6-phosphate isomerase/deaminase